VPNIKSSKKDLRRSRRRAIRNADIRSGVKTAVKKARAVVAEKGEGAAAATRSAQQLLDRAATKGAVHKRSAARRKSRLAKALRKVQAGSPPSAAA
jgi:small subunit ribosomal protein S20